MNVSCSSCDTVYRIDPDKVPEAGVRVRCTVCSNVISVSRDEEIAVIAAPVDGAVQPAVAGENRPPAVSQEQMAAAVLGDAFIAPPEQPVGTTAPPAPPVTEPIPAPAEPPAVPSPPPPPTPIPVAEAPPAAAVPPAPLAPSRAPESPAARPGEPVPPPAALPTPVSEAPEAELPPAARLGPVAQPSPVATAPRPPAVQPTVDKGALRIARPFSPPAPGRRPTGAPREPERPIAPVFRPTPGMPLKPAVPLPAEAKPPAAFTPPAAPPAAQPPGAPATPPGQPVVNPFMSKDPKQKARRLARALISDMIVYQPEKREQALEDGSLKEVFGEEIKKSWEAYVRQVGEEIADSTPFFDEALNEILAGGESVF